MTVRYVSTDDNKYVQYRLMNQTFSTNEADWQGINDEIAAGSKNTVESGCIYNAWYKSAASSLGTNIINFDLCEINKGLSDNGIIANANGYAISPYIPVKNGDVISFNGYSGTSGSWSSLVVFDNNGTIIRHSYGNNTYEYEEGDAYVRFMFDSNTISACRANYGNTLSAYKKYNPISGYLTELEDVVGSNVEKVNDLYQKTDGLEEEVFGKIKRVYNIGTVASAVTIPAGNILLKVTTSGSGYCDVKFYDASDTLIVEKTAIYTNNETVSVGVTLNNECKKVVFYTRNVIHEYEIIIDDSLKELIQGNSEKITEIENIVVKEVTVTESARDSSWRYNGVRLNAMKIDEYGNLSGGNSGFSGKGALFFIDPRIKTVTIKARPYQTSGSTALYAFYSDNIIFDNTTCVGVGPQVTGLDTTAKVYKDVIVPSGTKALVLNSESFDSERFGVTGIIYIDDDVKGLWQKVDGLVDNIPLKDVTNGERTYYSTVDDYATFPSPERDGGGYADKYNNLIHWYCLNNGVSVNNWFCSPIFNPSGDHLVHVRFRIKFLSTPKTVNIELATGTTGSTLVNSIGTLSKDGEYDFTFDPTYYRVYQSMTDKFCVWVHCNGQVDGVNATITDFTIFENKDDELLLSVIKGNNAREMFKSADENIADVKEELDNPTLLIAPNGNKYELTVNNQGLVVALPVIPSKGAMFGNSLIMGNSSSGIPAFGMCASDKDKDYYALINSVCANLNPNYVSTRLGCVEFETISSLSNIDTTIASVLDNLNGDEDFIVIQAGDNVSTENAVNIWPTSTMKFAQAIRSKCPNARICWPAIWYSTPQKMECVRNACKKWGVTFIDISDLNIKANQGTIGDLIDFGSTGSDNWTLENVSNLVDNGNNNITVTFTYNGVTATTTLDVASFSLSGTTLTYNGRYKIVTLQAGHPGDRGFRAISNRVLYKMGLTDNEEYYTLDE